MFAGGGSSSGSGGTTGGSTVQSQHAPAPNQGTRSPNGRQPSPAYLPTTGYHGYHGQSHQHAAAAAAAAYPQDANAAAAAAYHGMYPSAMDPSAMAWHAAAYSAAGAAHLYGRAGSYADALESVWSPQLNTHIEGGGEFHYQPSSSTSAAVCNNDNHLGGRDSGSVSPPPPPHHHHHHPSQPPPPPPVPPSHQELKPSIKTPPNQTHSSPDSGLTDSGSGSPSATSAAHLGYLTAAGGAAAAAAAAAAIASSLGNSSGGGASRGVDTEAPSGGNAASRPQPVRSPYEWMKRPNFNTKSSAKEGNIAASSK